jgi:hypothetical protein
MLVRCVPPDCSHFPPSSGLAPTTPFPDVLFSSHHRSRRPTRLNSRRSHSIAFFREPQPRRRIPMNNLDSIGPATTYRNAPLPTADGGLTRIG